MDWEIISSYSNEQAIEDGVKLRLGDGLFATTALACEVAPLSEGETVTDILTGERVLFNPATFVTFVSKVLALYNAGIFTNTGSSDADQYFAVYEIGEERYRVWAIADGDGLTLLRPEDY